MRITGSVLFALIAFAVAGDQACFAQGSSEAALQGSAAPERRADPAPVNADSGAVQSMADIESRYRRHLGEITRLKALARESGNERRWNDLVALERSLQGRYESELQEFRRRWGNAEFQKHRDMINGADERRRLAAPKRRSPPDVSGPDRSHPADANHDGVVDDVERRTWSSRGHDSGAGRDVTLPSPAADTNHDGVIDKAEREAWEQRGRREADQRPAERDPRSREAEPQRKPSNREAQKPQRHRPQTQPPPKRPSKAPPPPRKPPPPKRDPAGKPSRGSSLAFAEAQP